MAHRFLGIRNEADPQFREPPSDRRLRGFILEGYFAPRFQYDSNRNGWRCSFAQLFAVPGQYRAIVKREGWAIIPGRLSLWTEAIDQALSPLAITGYLAWNGLSFQEADNLYEWAMAALHKGATGHDADPNITSDLIIADTACEGPGRSLEYYEERADQAGFLVDFQDIEALPSDTNSLLGVNEVAGYMPTSKQKKKHCSRCKTTDSDNESPYSSWGEAPWGDDEDAGPPWNPEDQMDVNNNELSQM